MSAGGKTILIMAGGTGGHIIPGISVAEELKSRGWNIAWMGNADGMEAQLIAGRGYEPAWIRFSALRGKGLARKLMLPVNLLRGFLQAWQQLGRIKPDVVIGLGGYISFPGGMMAVLRGIPLVLHEQNSVAGMANRVLAMVASRVLSGFPNVLRKAEWVGNPVRPEIAAIAPPAERYPARSGALRLLVVGGSLGAKVLNELVPDAMSLFAESERPEIRHQSGKNHLASLQQRYAQCGVTAQCVAFITDMPAAYAWADLVICRSGALTIAELAAAGVPSILVPFPHAVDDHQTTNARFLADAGAAILIPQSALNAEDLAKLRSLSRDQLCEMGEKARALARPDATGVVASICEEVAQ